MRWRRLLALGAALGCVAVGGVWFWLVAGGPEWLIARRYASLLPGSLRVAEVELAGFDQAWLRGIELLDDEGRTVAEVEMVTVIGSWSGEPPELVQGRGVVLQLDAGSRPFWQRWLQAVDALRASAAASGAACRLQVDDIRLQGAGVALENMQLQGRVQRGAHALNFQLGPAATAALQSDPASGVTRLVLDGSWPLRRLAGLVHGCGLLALDPAALALLPAEVDCSDSFMDLDAAGGGTLALAIEPDSLPVPVPLRSLRVHGDLLRPEDGLQVTIGIVGVTEALRAELSVDWRHRQLRIAQLHGQVPLAPVFALADWRPPAVIADWLPPAVELQGQAWQVDLTGPVSATGDWVVQWPSGSARGWASFTDDGLAIERIVLRDRVLGECDARLQLDSSGNGRLVWSRVQFAPTMAFLHGLAKAETGVDLLPFVQAVNAVLPQGSFSWQLSAGKRSLSLGLSGADGAQMRISLDAADFGALRAARIPLAIIQALAPDVRLAAGMVERLQASRGARGWDLQMTVSGGDIGIGAWRLQPVDGDLRYRRLADDRFALRWDFAEDAWLAYEGGRSSGRLQADLVEIASLLPRVRGPVTLPPLSGRVRLDCQLNESTIATPVRLDALQVDGLDWPGIFADLVGTTTGTLTWWQGRLEAVLSGVVNDGVVTAAGWNIPVESGKPEWHAAVAWDGVDRLLRVRQFLARGPVDAATRFTLGVRGDLRLQAPYDGSLQLVVDPVNTRWLHGMLGRPQLSDGLRVAGEASLVANLGYRQTGLELVEGWVLPIGMDLELFDGVLALQGIRGSIHLPRQAIAGPGPRPPSQTGTGTPDETQTATEKDP